MMNPIKISQIVCTIDHANAQYWKEINFIEIFFISISMILKTKHSMRENILQFIYVKA